MKKVAMVNVRIEPSLKKDAESILNQIGLSSAEAIRLFYKQVCLNKGLPFDVRLPNEETLKAMREVKAGKTFKAKSGRALIDEIMNDKS